MMMDFPAKPGLFLDFSFIIELSQTTKGKIILEFVRKILNNQI